MKKTLCLLLILVSSVASADELCGMLSSKVVAPVCPQGQACPDFMTLVYTVTPANGVAVVVSMSDLAALQSAESLEGQNVCVDGTMSGQSFSAVSIQAQN